eukprot:scaffold312355_cov39-Tisochrysis_lutea.AAC.1
MSLWLVPVEDGDVQCTNAAVAAALGGCLASVRAYLRSGMALRSATARQDGWYRRLICLPTVAELRASTSTHSAP